MQKRPRGRRRTEAEQWGPNAQNKTLVALKIRISGDGKCLYAGFGTFFELHDKQRHARVIKYVRRWEGNPSTSREAETKKKYLSGHMQAGNATSLTVVDFNAVGLAGYSQIMLIRVGSMMSGTQTPD
jgi:hypothetical protein